MKRLFRLAAIVMLLSLLACALPACGALPAQPTETPFVPEPVINGNAFTITALIPVNDDSRDRYQKGMDYLQGLLKQRGWNVRLKVESVIPDGQTGELRYTDALQQSAAAGNLADGYPLRVEEAKELAKSGLVKKMSGLVKEVAPPLYDRYRAYFEQDGSGVPTAGFCSVWGWPTVLYLKKEIAAGLSGQPMTMAKLFTLMEADPALKIGFNGFAFDPILEALKIWAMERGYYPLEFCDMGASGLFALATDPECTPIPVERISGFEDVFASMLRYANEGRFFDLGNPKNYVADASGYAGSISPEMYRSFLPMVKAAGSDFLALPFQGCGAPRLPADDPYITSVLAVPLQSGKTEQLVAFALWAQTAGDGYDLIRYGAEGVDYRIDGDRIEFLNNGKAMAEQDWDFNTSLAYCINAPFSVYSEDLERVTIYTAKNYGQLSGMQPVEYPAFAAKALRVPIYVSDRLFSNIYNELNGIIGDRHAFLSGYIYTAENHSQEKGDAEKCLAALKAMEKDSDRLVAAYRDRLQQLLHGAE